MPFSLLPKLIYPALSSICVDDLYDRGIRLLMLDFDNTIVPYTTNEPTAEISRWLSDALSSKVQICVVSNSKHGRVVDFCRKYGIPCITRAKKPFSRGICACMEKFSQKPSACALVGDQIYTDVLGGNCAGITSILVSAIDNHNIWLKLRHVLELPWIFAAGKRRVK